MSHLKKTLAIFLLVCMLASMMPVGTAFAAADVPTDGTATETTTGDGTPEGNPAGTTNTQSEGTTPGTQSTDTAPLADAGAGDACPHDQSTWEAIPGKAATCTEKGLTEGKRCPACNKTTVEQTEISALGHDWSGKNGTCARNCGEVCTHSQTAEGGGTVSTFVDGTCGVCGLVCAHPSVEDVAEAKATCTTAGHAAGKRCTVCGVNTEGGTEVPALGHKWDYTDPKLAKCTNGCGETCSHEKTADGTTTKLFEKGVCSVCSYPCTHKKADGSSAFDANSKCGICDHTCTHEWDTTNKDLAKCKLCGKTCNHKNADGTTAFSKGVCGLCKNPCKHENVTGDTCNDCKQSFQAMITSADSSTKTYYAQLKGSAGAFKKAINGDTITLLKDVELTSNLALMSDNLNIILNLNDHNLTFNITASYYNNALYLSAASSSITIKKGTITASREVYVQGKGSVLTIESDVNLVSTANPAVRVGKNATVNLNGTITGTNTGIFANGEKATVNVNGTINGCATGVYVEALNTTVNINQSGKVLGSEYGVHVGVNGEVTGSVVNVCGTLEATKCALLGNGVHHGTTFNIKDGAVLTADDVAIYQPQEGTLNIEGGTITGGATGVEVRAGTVNISGGTITGGTTTFKCEKNGSGSTTTGAGLAVVQHTTGRPINVTISGGAFTGTHAIHEQDVEGNGVAENGTVNISITGNSADLKLTGLVYSSDDRITFEGGESDRLMDVPVADDPNNPNAVVADPNCVHAGANNKISAGAKTDAVILKKALAECATEDYTIVTVDTDAASVSLDGAALKTIDGAVTAADGSAIVHVEKVAETKDGKKFRVYITDQDGNPIASDGATLDGGKATVVLKGITTEPKQVKHYDLQADGITNKFMVHIVKPEFTYEADKDTVTVKIDHFSYLETSMEEAPEAPEITTDENLPTAYIGKEYPETKLDATGTKPITWSKDETTNAWPSWLTLDETTGTIKANGPVPADATDTTITVTATNAAGESVTKDFTIKVEEYVVARLIKELPDGKFEEIGTYATVQDAVDAAEAVGDDANYSVIVEKDSPSEEVRIDGAVNILGNGLNGAAIKLKSITCGPDSGVGIMFVEAETVTVEQGAAAYLGEGNDIGTVVNGNKVGNVDNPDASVLIDGGHYGKLSPAGSKTSKPAESGSYLVTGGTFGVEIPMEYCRFDIDAGGNIVLDENGEPKIVQRYAKYDAARGAYLIVPFKFDITAVSNSGYHMPGSRKTLVFSTNLDYRLAVRDSDKATITLTYGKSSKDITSLGKISEGPNGKAQITLNANTLNKLALGRYTLTYDGPTGRDSMYFHISNTVKTGDTSNIGLWMGIMGVSVVALCAVAAVLVIKSKKKNGGAKAKNDKE